MDGTGTHRAVVEEGLHGSMTAWDMFLFLNTPWRGRHTYLPRKSRILERILSFVSLSCLVVLEPAAKLLEWFLNRYLHYIHDWTAG